MYVLTHHCTKSHLNKQPPTHWEKELSRLLLIGTWPGLIPIISSCAHLIYRTFFRLKNILLKRAKIQCDEIHTLPK